MNGALSIENQDSRSGPGLFQHAFIPLRAAHYPPGSAAAQISWLCDTREEKIFIFSKRMKSFFVNVTYEHSR